MANAVSDHPGLEIERKQGEAGEGEQWCARRSMPETRRRASQNRGSVFFCSLSQ